MMSYTENGNRSRLENCFEKLELIEANFRFCANPKELGQKMGVHESAAKQIVALTAQVREELSALEGGLS
jgi:hypothetical protein